ncbi:hypothetical protein [Actibacterium ureilyticum]|uniref:hypothetical protein n=1 Tax=Actibacterium ureilyticum TaxID=1590614 RepID=UPI000BAADB16|nr:hypothetical protein [Actibacterium ureilyticum]
MSDTTAPASVPVRPIYRRPLEWGMIGLAIIVLIFIAKTLDVLPDELKAFGAEAKFGKEDKQVLVQNDARLNELVAELEKLKQDVAMLAERNGGSRQVSSAAILESPAKEIAASSSFLQQSTVPAGEGVMWLGEWDSFRGWTDGSITGQNSALQGPETLAGAKVRLTTKVNIREAYPSRDASYFRTVPVLGVADKDAIATIIDVAPGYQRATGVQYWAKVRVDYTPKEPEAVEATRSLRVGN